MTNRILSLLLIVGSLFLTSCFEITEHVHLNKDGSGKIVTEMDMGDIFNNPFMKGALEEEMTKEGASVQDMEQDSMIYFKDAPAEADLTPEERLLIKDATMRIQMSQSKGKFAITTTTPFESFEQLTQINNAIAKATAATAENGTSNPMMDMMQGSGFSGESPQFTLKRRKLTRLPASPMPAEVTENLEMMRMFLSGVTSTTVYHLPGRVKKTTIPNAVVDGKTVTVTTELLDILEEKVKTDGEICFKRR